MTEAHHIQGSQEWLDWRKTKYAASEAAAALNVGKYWPKTQPDLFDLKTGRKSAFVNEAMRRGTDLEPVARASLEELIGEALTPSVCERGDYIASMDGVTFDGRVGVEIKCPASEESLLFSCKNINDLKAFPHYYWQIVHQFYVGRFMQIHFYVYHPNQQTFFTVRQDEVVSMFDVLCEAWERFGEALRKNERPSLDEDDPELIALTDQYIEINARFEEVKKELESCQEQMKQYAKTRGAKKISCSGVSISLVERKGNIDYAKIPELKGINLEMYRKKPSTFYQITTAKEK